MADLRAARKIVDAATAAGATSNLPAIAFQVSLAEGVDPGDPNLPIERSLLVAPCVHPVLEAYLDLSGATRTGRMSWLIGRGEGFTPFPLQTLLDRVRPGLLWPERATVGNNRAPYKLPSMYPYRLWGALGDELGRAGVGMNDDQRRRFYNGGFPRYDSDDKHRFGAIAISVGAQAVYIKGFTTPGEVPDQFADIPLNLRPAGKSFADPRPVRPVDAMPLLDYLARQGVAIVDKTDGALARLRATISSSLVATPLRGKPALASVSVGSRLFTTHRGQVNTLIGKATEVLPEAGVDDEGEQPHITPPHRGTSAKRMQVSATEVAAFARHLPADQVLLHPGTEDIGRMALASPHEDDRLRPYQKQAVGIHLSTGIGYCLTVEPGMGKTVITYVAMGQRAQRIPRYRGLVVLEANVRQQWLREAETWFPGARVVAVESSKDNGALYQALQDDGPVVALVSYKLLEPIADELAIRAQAQVDPLDGGLEITRPVNTSTMQPGASRDAWAQLLDNVGSRVPEGQVDLFTLLAEDEAQAAGPEQAATQAQAQEEVEEVPAPPLAALLLDEHWHDLVADEAEVLRSTGTKQGTALWQLRSTSDVATVLTGTPINRTVDDLGRLISWVRNDEHLFHGVKLSTQFDLDSKEGQTAFAQAMGPVVFRRDSSEIQHELPTVKPTVLKLRPSVEEKALASAAEHELKRVYNELMSWLEIAEQSEGADPVAFAEAREQLKAARGAVMGGAQLARMASSDPAALVGSESAAAQLLHAQGLIEAANGKPGTKRTAVVADVTRRVMEGHKVLIFTEFASVARGLIQDLDAAGVRVGEVLGGGGKKRDRHTLAFQNGELDVLVCTSAGERGLTLTAASVLYHYDLPWVPKSVIQRQGRMLRIGTEHREVEVVFPIMEGTIEERVAGLVVSRAVEAMQALDASRGVDTSKTEMGLALSGLIEAVDDPTVGKAEGNALLAMTAALVA